MRSVGNPEGVARAGGVREVAEPDSGSDGPQYSRTATGDTQVVELSCVETLWVESEREKGQDMVAPPGRHRVAGVKGRSVNKKNSYVTINDGS